MSNRKVIFGIPSGDNHICGKLSRNVNKQVLCLFCARAYKTYEEVFVYHAHAY